MSVWGSGCKPVRQVYRGLWVRQRDMLWVTRRKKYDGWLQMKLWKQSAFGTIPISLSGWVACQSPLQHQTVSAMTHPAAPVPALAAGLSKKPRKTLETESSHKKIMLHSLFILYPGHSSSRTVWLRGEVPPDALTLLAQACCICVFQKVFPAEKFT